VQVDAVAAAMSTMAEREPVVARLATIKSPAALVRRLFKQLADYRTTWQPNKSMLRAVVDHTKW